MTIIRFPILFFLLLGYFLIVAALGFAQTTDTIFLEACQGDLYEGNLLNQDTLITTVHIAQDGSDSLEIANITVHPVHVFNAYIELCEFADRFGSEPSYRNDIFIDTLQSIHGCDSIIITELIINYHTTTVQEEAICPSESLMVGNSVYTESGIYLDTLLSSQECDSVVVTVLTVSNPVLVYDTIYMCQNESYQGQYFLEDTLLVDTIQLLEDCSKVEHIFIDVSETYEYFEEYSICEGDSLFLAGAFRKNSNVYIDSLQTIYGCDSVFVADLEVIPIDTSYQTLFTCNNELVGVFENWYSNQFGCDSLVVEEYLLQEQVLSDGNMEVCENTLYKGILLKRDTQLLETYEMTNGCDSLHMLDIKVYPAPSASVEVVQNPCEDSLALLNFQTPVGGTAPFLYAINETPYQENPAFENLDTGSYFTILEDVNGCTWDSLIRIEKAIIPEIHLSKIESINLGESHQLEFESNVESFEQIIWSPAENLSCSNCTSPIARPIETTNYTLTVRTIDGCLLRENILLKVEKEPSVYIPNVFSPNNDGINDFFTVYGNEQVSKVLSLKIFDRWGNMIFEQTDFLPNDIVLGWNGTYKGQKSSSGVYVFVAEVAFENGQIQILSSDFTLVR